VSTSPPIETVSHYRLLELLGRGAMGEVWLAEDLQLPRRVAVKLLPRHLSEDPEAVERLLREARAAATVDHPNVVTVHDAGVVDGQAYLVMQRVEGETLERRLERGVLPPADAIAMAAAIADALAEVHALGIVHRDLKPSNIMLTTRGPKVLDFGLAAVRGHERMTEAGPVVGTPLYMSPEQVRGAGQPLRPVGAGRDPVRGVDGRAAVHGRQPRDDDARGAARGARSTLPSERGAVAAARRHRREAAAEGSRPALRARRGSDRRPRELRARR
jgi:serine/threonine-protein kinase